MSENITVNVNQGAGSSGENLGGSSTLESILKFIISLVAIASIAFFIITLFLVVDNWEWIVTTFTTGFIGWLNPFDDPEGDFDPTAYANPLRFIPGLGPFVSILGFGKR